MALDGLALGFVARELNDKLLGGRIDRVQQPEKDMVVIFIRSAGENHRLLINANPTGTRMHLTGHSYESPQEAPVFCMLMRKHLVSGRVLNVEQMYGDRLIRIDIQALDEMGEKGEKQLYFEAMGRHSNLSLVQDGQIIDCLRHVTDEMSRVRRMLPGAQFELPPMQDKLQPGGWHPNAIQIRLASEGGRLDKAVASSLMGIGAATAREICLRLTGQETPQAQAIDLALFSQALADFLSKVPKMHDPRLYMDEQGLPKDALPFAFLGLPPERQQPRQSFSEALDHLHYERDRYDRLQQRSAAFRRSLSSAQERVLRKLALQEEELLEAQRMEEYRIAGELLTAYGHMVPKGAEQAALPNYYADGEELMIKLDPALSAAANAQAYFKKYRKAHTARRAAAEQKENSLKELALLEDALWAVQEIQRPEDIAEIREPLSQAGLIRAEAPQKGRKQKKESPFLRFKSPDGLTILVGRNSLQNERLLRGSQGRDLWLHAKDMAGSHVIVQSPGDEVPQATLMLAAQLAAWYSKGKGEAVPVNYTRRRLVKKPAGTPPGFVTFTGEKLLIISAEEADIAPYQEKD